MATRQMSVQDALWLTMDRPNNLMVVDGAMVLREQITREHVKEVMETTGARFPVFKRKPVRSGQSWLWKDDPSYNLDDHVVSVKLDEPVDMTFVPWRDSIPRTVATFPCRVILAPRRDSSERCVKRSG